MELGETLSENADKRKTNKTTILAIKIVVLNIFPIVFNIMINHHFPWAITHGYKPLTAMRPVHHLLLASNNFFFSSSVRQLYPDFFILSRIRSISAFS